MNNSGEIGIQAKNNKKIRFSHSFTSFEKKRKKTCNKPKCGKEGQVIETLEKTCPECGEQIWEV